MTIHQSFYKNINRRLRNKSGTEITIDETKQYVKDILNITRKKLPQLSNLTDRELLVLILLSQKENK